MSAATTGAGSRRRFDEGKSLAAYQRQKAKHVAKPGQGDRGDRRAH